MRQSMKNDSRATYVGGRNGLVVGAVVGAVIATVVAAVFAYFEVGAGGPGMHAMAGAALGGLAGWFWGSLSGRRGLAYAGTERRVSRDPYPGQDRRMAR